MRYQTKATVSISKQIHSNNKQKFKQFIHSITTPSHSKMSSHESFTSQDYLSNLLQNKIHHNYNPQSQNQEDTDNDFTPFMKRHSSSGDSYVREGEFAGDRQNERSEGLCDEDMDRSAAFSKRYQEHNQIQDQTKEDTRLDDSFLQLVDQHLSDIQSQTNNQPKQSQLSNQDTISLSKSQICHSLLQNQSITDSIQVTNLLPTPSIANIINSPFEFRLLNAKNKFIKKDQVQILLQPYETVEIEFQIKKRQAEIGNIYQTLKIETYESTGNGKKGQAQKKFIKFEITFIKPKLQMTFLGRTLVRRIQQHKIAHLQLYPNSVNEYFLNIIFSQQQFSTLQSSSLERIECQIQAKGYISVHPSSVILYKNEALKVAVRRLGQLSGAGKTSAVLIKPLHSSLVYVVGVKCMDRKVEEKDEEQNMMAKFQF